MSPRLNSPPTEKVGAQENRHTTRRAHPRGTDGSNPSPSREESANHRFLSLIRERFAPGCWLRATSMSWTNQDTNLDPFRAWKVMMTGEKPGGHGERCVAVGALDMALWDAAAKIAQLPLYRFLADRTPAADVLGRA